MLEDPRGHRSRRAHVAERARDYDTLKVGYPLARDLFAAVADADLKGHAAAVDRGDARRDLDFGAKEARTEMIELDPRPDGILPRREMGEHAIAAGDFDIADNFWRGIDAGGFAHEVDGAGGIEPDIEVPQLTDPDYKDRKFIRESDLRRHLLAQAQVKDALLESDDRPDPRFSAKAEDLKKQGIKDFQLHYAVNTIKRLGAPAKANIAAGGSASKKSR